MENRPVGAPPHLPWQRDPAPALDRVRHEWGGRADLWVFGYASLIWRPDLTFDERPRAATPPPPVVEPHPLKNDGR